MNIITHELIDRELCGTPLKVSEGYSQVEMTTIERMAVDDPGLVHGGFIFGLADYAAMIAINHPNVVLGGSQVRFLKPVKTGERVVAEARVEDASGKKQEVQVVVRRDETAVFEGTFTCFVLDRHVLC